MHILNLIGLIMGYLGSISLSLGIIKSKQEVIDEETPFWGPNPFKMRSTLRSRLLGFSGVALLVAGFATTSVTTALDTVFDIDDLPLAVSTIALLTATAYAILWFALKAKHRAHIDAKSRYYFNEIIKEARKLKDEYEKKSVIITEDDSLADLKKQYVGGLSKDLNYLKPDDKKIIEKLISSIDKAQQLPDMVAALSDFLAEYDSGNHTS